MIVYLPVAFLKDWLCRYLDRRSSKSSKVPALTDESSVGSPLRHKIIEMGLQGTITKKDSEEHLSSHEEDERPLIGKVREEVQTLKQRKEITTKQIAMYGLYLAPIWFVTEVSFCCICIVLMVPDNDICLLLFDDTVSVQCCSCSYKCGKHYCIVFNLGTVYSFHWCIFGPRYFKLVKSSCCICQHGWGGHDDARENLGC